MLHKPQTCSNIGDCAVVLKDAAAASLAHQVLNGSTLFTNRVIVAPPGPTKSSEFLSQPRFFWGWHAYADPDILNAKRRSPLTQPPVDIFRPVREGRRVTVDYAAMSGRDEHSLEATRRIYSMFHSYELASRSPSVYYERKLDGQRRASIHLDFCLRESADEAVSLFNKYKIDGVEHTVSK